MQKYCKTGQKKAKEWANSFEFIEYSEKIYSLYAMSTSGENRFCADFKQLVFLCKF